MSREAAVKKRIRTRMISEAFSHYAKAIDDLEEVHVGVVKTSDLKQTRKNLLLVAKKLGVKLSTLRTPEGLQFWIASDEEVKSRKKKP